MKKSSRLIRTVCILVAVAVLICIALMLPRYPSPEYSVSSYDELSGKIGRLCLLPEKDALPDTDGTYTVYVKARNSGKAVGYLISFSPAENFGESLSISCKSLTALPEEWDGISPTESYGGTELSVTKDHTAFILNGFLYDIHGTKVTDAFSGYAMTIAQDIIDQSK